MSGVFRFGFSISLPQARGKTWLFLCAQVCAEVAENLKTLA